jgi:hypothetical protein
MSDLERLETVDLALAAFCLARRYRVVEVRQDVNNPALSLFVFNAPTGTKELFTAGGLLVDPAAMHNALRNARDRARSATGGASHIGRHSIQADRNDAARREGR